MGLTKRQKEILLAIIEEYMESPDEVGSSQLIKKHDFEVSSATIRNEMVKLMDMGYLEKTHQSSGRLPTDLAFRLYINEKVNREVMNSVEMVDVRQGIFRVRFSPEKLIHSILRILEEQSGTASFILMEDMTRHYGISSLINYEELQNVKFLQRILDLLEDENLLKSVFSKSTGDDVNVLIGSELGIQDLNECAIAFTKFDFWDDRTGHMGVVGSRRMNYQKVIPLLSEVRSAVHSSLKGWS
jgi:heat-inducible transcriptional repressor